MQYIHEKVMILYLLYNNIECYFYLYNLLVLILAHVNTHTEQEK